MGKKVVIGISGGIDSLVASILLKNQGYRVIGVTLILWKKPDKEKIRQIVDKLKIEHYYIDLRNFFKTNIVDNFVSDYLNGQTPNPCTLCNDIIKWHFLKKFADENNIEKIATGHYIDIVFDEKKYYIVKGIDEKKDQSYFLWRLNQDYLKRTICPLGKYYKEQIKQIAIDNGFGNFKKQKESMSICFLENKNYRNFIIENADKNYKSLSVGQVFDINNNVIGTHSGVAFYTVGQKSGLNIKSNKKLAVSKIDAKSNSIFVDETMNLYKNEFYVRDYKFIDDNDIKSKNISVLIRGLGINPNKYANLQICSNGLLKVKLQDKAWALAPGQPVVFYINNKLIGGGYVYE